MNYCSLDGGPNFLLGHFVQRGYLHRFKYVNHITIISIRFIVLLVLGPFVQGLE